MLSATGGGHAIEFFEVASEVAAVAYADLIHGLFHTEVGGFQQYSGMQHSGGSQELSQRLSRVLFE